MDTNEFLDVLPEDKKIIETWFPEGMPDPDDDAAILAAWSGISLKLALIPFELSRDGKREITPAGADHVRRTIEFMGIGWAELEEGALLAIREGIKALRAMVPGVPERVL